MGATAANRKVTHRDLKPENLMLVNKDDLSQLRLIDFGLSRFFKPDTRCTTRVGTVYYTAPEVMCGDGGVCVCVGGGGLPLSPPC